jgi:GH24 family phage-related lysozyme (muramidase)
MSLFHVIQAWRGGREIGIRLFPMIQAWFARRRRPTHLSGTTSRHLLADASRSSPIITEGLLRHFKDEEGCHRDRRTGKLKPYPSLEGGTPTWGYGHKGRPGEKPQWLTEAEATELLRADARQRLPYAAAGIDNRCGPGTWARMELRHKQAALDFAFNLGPSWARKFPRLTEALGRGDDVAAAANCKRFYRSEQTGKMEPLTRRNETFKRAFLSGFPR